MELVELILYAKNVIPCAVGSMAHLDLYVCIHSFQSYLHRWYVDAVVQY